MAGDPTPDEYDEPFVHEEWGVMVKATGELARQLDEHTARLTCDGRADLQLIRRTVTYDVWHTAT